MSPAEVAELTAVEVSELSAIVEAVKKLRDAHRLTAADLAIRRNQGARDDDWADLCATRRAWAEIVRLLDGIEGL